MMQVSRLHKALLVMQSPTDDTVGIDNATRIFVAAKHPKSFVSLSGADHLLTRKSDAVYAAGVIAAWVMHYLEPAVPEQAADQGLAPRNVVVPRPATAGSRMRHRRAASFARRRAGRGGRRRHRPRSL